MPLLTLVSKHRSCTWAKNVFISIKKHSFIPIRHTHNLFTCRHPPDGRLKTIKHLFSPYVYKKKKLFSLLWKELSCSSVKRFQIWKINFSFSLALQRCSRTEDLVYFLMIMFETNPCVCACTPNTELFGMYWWVTEYKTFFLKTLLGLGGVWLQCWDSEASV